jgi:hypothetical protein
MNNRVYFVEKVKNLFPCGTVYIVYEATQDYARIKAIKGFPTLKEANSFRDRLISEQRKENRTK